MKIDVRFSEISNTFRADMGEVQQLDPPVIIRKEIAENGTYRAGDEGAAAFNPVVVAVPSETETVDALIEGTLTAYRNDRVTKVGSSVFAVNTTYTSISLPNATLIGNGAFNGARVLVDVELPKVATLEQNAFINCSGIKKIVFPSLESIGPAAFRNCSGLTAIIISTPSVCALVNANAFSVMPVETGAGYIYVPKALVEQYKTAPNWSNYASQIRAIEGYPDICGGTYE